MLIGRVRTVDGIRWARDDGGRTRGIEDPFAAFAEGREPADGDALVSGETATPCDPVVLVGIAQNGAGHPSPVQAWLKSPRTVVASGVAVRLRRDAGDAVAEGEIAVVIGRSTEGLTAANAHEYVLGITAVNDLSSPDRAESDPRNFESKSGEGYTPLGPWIDTGADLDDIALKMATAGTTVVSTTASELPVAIRDCLAYVAGWTPLGPGDVVMTGAPHSQVPVGPDDALSIIVGRVTLSTAFI